MSDFNVKRIGYLEEHGDSGDVLLFWICVISAVENPVSLVTSYRAIFLCDGELWSWLLFCDHTR